MIQLAAPVSSHVVPQQLGEAGDSHPVPAPGLAYAVGHPIRTLYVVDGVCLDTLRTHCILDGVQQRYLTSNFGH